MPLESPYRDATTYDCHICGESATRGLEPDAKPICDTHIIAVIVVSMSEGEQLTEAQFCDLEDRGEHDVTWSEITRIAHKRHAAVVAEAWAAMKDEELQNA